MKAGERDIFFMQKALSLALKGRGFTSPNPMVGAVIVKGGRLVSWGYHRKAGLPHAEIEAIERAGVPLEGATLYVNLEPCCHFGRTPPCVDEIIRQGIKRVVIGVLDPNPSVCGKSVRKLRKEGIEVKVGVCRAQSLKVNEIFFKNYREGRVFVAAKVAQTLDGKISSTANKSKWITSLFSRKYARSLRDAYDCILVGANTLSLDNPSLSGLKRDPLKAVVTSNLKKILSSRLARTKPSSLIVFTGSRVSLKGMPASLRVIVIKPQKGRVPVKSILKELFDLGVRSLFVEGGSQVLGYFFDESAVDKIYFFMAPKILGGKKALTSVGGRGFTSPESCPVLENMNIKLIDKDILVEAYPVYKKINV